MKHQLNISVSKEPQSGGIVRCKNVTLREKLLTMLFGCKEKVMVLVPGDSIQTLSIVELPDGGADNE